jgi:hypothetical protein
MTVTLARGPVYRHPKETNMKPRAVKSTRTAKAA